MSNNTMLYVALGVGSALIASSVAAGFMFKDKLGGGDSSGGGVEDEDIVSTGESGVDVDVGPAVSGLDGTRLITVGENSMVVVGSSCSNGRVAFREQDGSKWVWRLTRISSFNGKDVYTIESDYKNFDRSCDERWLTAPAGCGGPPFVAKRRSGPSQSWMIYSSGGGYQIRSLSCIQGRRANTYLMASGSDKDMKPKFSSGSGSAFTISDVVSSDVQ